MDSRAQFEAWWETEWCGDAPMDGWQYLRGDDGYIDEGINAQWEAWQAARAAIEVTLPEKVMVEDEYDRGHNYGIQYCEEAIKAAGISIKGESS